MNSPISKMNNITFYYIIPTSLGFLSGLLLRDTITLNTNKKIEMSLFDYYDGKINKANDYLKINYMKNSINKE